MNKLMNLKEKIWILALFLFQYTENFNPKFTKRHPVFCFIHDAIITILILIGISFIFIGLSLVENSTAVGMDFWYDCLHAFKFAGTGFGIIVLIGSANDLFEDVWDE